MLVTHTTKRGTTSIPFSAIVSARRTPGRDGWWTITDTGGGEHQVDDISWDTAIELTAITSIPALPGTYLIARGEEEDGTEFIHRTAVLGWSVCADGETRPMTLDTEALLSAWFVEMPDGRVEAGQGNTSWESVEAWRDDFKSRSAGERPPLEN